MGIKTQAFDEGWRKGFEDGVKYTLLKQLSTIESLADFRNLYDKAVNRILKMHKDDHHETPQENKK